MNISFIFENTKMVKGFCETEMPLYKSRVIWSPLKM